MTREEYVKKLNENNASLCDSLINDISKEVENINVYERCELSYEQSYFISTRQLESTIVKELEDKYPFLTFKLSNWNTLINWELKEKQ